MWHVENWTKGKLKGMYKNARKVARDDHANNIQSMICRNVGFGKGPGAMLPPDFDRSVNPI